MQQYRIIIKKFSHYVTFLFYSIYFSLSLTSQFSSERAYGLTSSLQVEGFYPDPMISAEPVKRSRCASGWGGVTLPHLDSRLVRELGTKEDLVCELGTKEGYPSVWGSEAGQGEASVSS